MQWENVQYLANSENYWYRSESEKPGLWVKLTRGGNWFHLNSIHLPITKSSLILASDWSWVKVYIQHIWNIPKFHIPPPYVSRGLSTSKFLILKILTWISKLSQICDSWCLKKFYFDDGPIFSDLHQSKIRDAQILKKKIENFEFPKMLAFSFKIGEIQFLGFKCVWKQLIISFPTFVSTKPA
jgi:hypothetical protein